MELERQTDGPEVGCEMVIRLEPIAEQRSRKKSRFVQRVAMKPGDRAHLSTQNRSEHPS